MQRSYSYFKRLGAISAIILSVLGIAIMLFFPDKIIKFLPASTYYLVLVFFCILFFSVLIYCLPKRYKFGIKYKGPYLKVDNRVFYPLTICYISIYILSIFYDVFIFNTIFYSVILLMVGLIVAILLTRRSYALALFLLLFLFLSYIFVVYVFYPPSLGNDTWRDIYGAMTKNGRINDISNNAYQIASVSILYSMISVCLGISPIYASVLMGFLYILMVSILAFIIANKLKKKLTSFSSFIALILILSMPIITLWSVSFIPQAFSFLLFLILLLVILSPGSFDIRNVLLVLPILTVLAVLHGGATLWILGFFALVLINMKFRGDTSTAVYLFIKRLFLILGFISILYFSYTTLITVLSQGAQRIFFMFLDALRLSSSPMSFVGPLSNPLATALFTYSSLAIAVSMGLIAWLGNKRYHLLSDVLVEAAFVYGLITLAVGFLGPIFLPSSVLDRYLGFGSLLLLSIISARGFGILLKKGATGKLFVAILSALLIMNIGFGAVLTPAFNPFNVNSNYSVKAPLDWAEKSNVNTIVSFTNVGAILTDWRTGEQMGSLLLDQYSGRKLYAGIEIQTNDGLITINTLGGYRSTITLEQLIIALESDQVFIYRMGALYDLAILVNSMEDSMYLRLLTEFDLVYNGAFVQAIR